MFGGSTPRRFERTIKAYSPLGPQPTMASGLAHHESRGGPNPANCGYVRASQIPVSRYDPSGVQRRVPKVARAGHRG